MNKMFAGALTSLALAGLLLADASDAQIPWHRHVQSFGPAPSDVGPNPQFGPEYGSAVAIRNGLAFVVNGGEHPDRSKVVVYAQTPARWVRTAEIKPGRGDRFHSAVVYRDGVLAVAANSGVYLFRRKDERWRLVQRLNGVLASELRYEDGVLVAASWDGVVQVIERGADGRFTRRTRLRSHEGRERFGQAISMAGPVIVVGARDSAYVFRRSSTGVWRQQQELVPGDRTNGGFGAAVAIDRGMILVSAPGADEQWIDGLRFASGAVYGFVPAAGVFVESFKIQPDWRDGGPFDGFGLSIAMFDKTIAVTAGRAFQGDGDVYIPGGSVFTYTRSGWAIAPRGIAHTVMDPDSLGLANNMLIVGSPFTEGCGALPLWGQVSIYDVSRYSQTPIEPCL